MKPRYRHRRHGCPPRLEASSSEYQQQQQQQQQRPPRTSSSLRNMLELKGIRSTATNNCSRSSQDLPRCTTRKKRRSFLDALSHEGSNGSISITLSTVSMISSDDSSSSCFNANEKKDAHDGQLSTPTSSYVDTREEEEDDDGYSSDQAVCDNISPKDPTSSGGTDQHRHNITEPIPIDEQEETKEKLLEAQKIAQRLLQEQTIALEAWDEVASEYHRRIEPFTSTFIPHMLHHQHLGLKAEHMYLKGKSVLDVAAGTGAGALYAMSRGASSVMATDFSPNMIHVLQNRIRDYPTLLPVETTVANGLCLPLNWSKKYDIVFSNFGCIYFPKVNEGLCEMIRCTKPGGKVCLSAWGNKEETHAFSVFPAAMKRCGLDKKWFEAQSSSRKEILASAGIEPSRSSSSSKRHPRSKKRYSGISLTPNYICPTTRISSSQYSLFSRMTNAGLDDVQVIPVTNDLRLDSAKNYWKRFVLASPNLKRFVEHCLSFDEVMELRNAVTDILQEEMDGPSSNPQEGGVVLKASAYIAIGTKRP